MERGGTGWTALVTRDTVQGAVITVTAMPPEPGTGPQAGPDPTPEPPAFAPSAFPPPRPYNPPPAWYPPPPVQDTARPSRPGMSARRIIVGVIWGAITVICAIGAVLEWGIGVRGGAVLCLVIAAGAGWYDYRIWTRRSRRLIA